MRSTSYMPVEACLFALFLLASNSVVGCAKPFFASPRLTSGWLHHKNNAPALDVSKEALTTRGGSTETSDELQQSVEAEDLYLPGLLDAALVNKNEVRTRSLLCFND